MGLNVLSSVNSRGVRMKMVYCVWVCVQGVRHIDGMACHTRHFLLFWQPPSVAGFWGGNTLLFSQGGFTFKCVGRFDGMACGAIHAVCIVRETVCCKMLRYTGWISIAHLILYIYIYVGTIHTVWSV